MPNIGNCEECGSYDILGYCGCANKHLCPKCGIKYTGVSEQELRQELKRQMEGIPNTK